MTTKYDWADIPDEVNWVATDADGISGYYTAKPFIERNEWVMDRPSQLVNCTYLGYEGDWKDSLEQRPGEQQ